MPRQTVTESKLKSPFFMEDLLHGVKALKNNKAAGLDDMLCEQIKHFGEATLRWLLQMMNSILKTQKFPKLWRKSKVIAILKPGKDSTLPKSYRLISRLCHTYKLFERMILNRLNPLVETMLVDLSAAYDTISHYLLLNKIYRMTSDIKFTYLIRNMLSDRRYFVELNGQTSRWRNQKNGIPQGSVLSPVLFNIYTNDQPIHKDTRSFIYADDLCIATQDASFEKTESTLSAALDSIGDYYEKNHLCANPNKIQTCVFHLRDRKANRQLNISWCGKKLEHTPSPIYLGITLDITLSYSTHIPKVKAKTAARNNVLRKLANSKWGTHPSTIKTTALALCYSTAEYACPVRERSARAHKVDPVLNDACRAITGCLQPTNVENLYLLAGIAPPAVRSVTAQREREKQVNDNRHPLHGHNLPRKRLKSRNSFIHATDELIQSPSTRRLEQWSQHLQSVPHRPPQTPSECLASGASGTWTEWRCLDRLRTKMGRCKHNLRKWKYTDEDDTTCDCKEADQTMEHLLECLLLRQTCSLDDLMGYNDVAKECVTQWIG